MPSREPHTWQRDRWGYVFFASHSRGDSAFGTVLMHTIQWCGASPLNHCAFAYGGAVLDARLDGNHFWPLLDYVERYPDLRAVYRVPLRYGVNLGFFEPLRYRRAWMPSLIRWLLNGRGPWADDCLCVTLACLIAGGVDVPDTIDSPGELDRYLQEQGHHCERHEQHVAGFRLAARQLIADSGT